MTVVARGLLTLNDVFDGVSLVLSSNAATVPTDDLGGNGNFSGCSTTVKVLNGPQDVTAQYTITPVSSVGITGSYSSNTYTVTAMTTDVGTVDFVATKIGADTLTARFTVSKAKRGAEGLSVVVSNENHTYPSDSSGNVINYAGSGTTIQVFEGSTALTAAANTNSVATFTIGLPVVSPALKITTGAISYTSTTATVAQHSAMASDTDVLTITYPVTIKRRDGSVVTVNKTQTISKAKQNSPVARGTVHVYAVTTGTVWDDAAANAATSAAPHNGRIIADRVTLYNQSAGWSQTRAWNGSAWITVNEVLDGNLLVTKSITADKININDLFSKSATITGQLSVGTATNFVKIGGANHILAQAGSRVLFLVNETGGLIDGYGLIPGSVTEGALSASALEKIRTYVGSSAPTTGGTKTLSTGIAISTFTLAAIPSGGSAVSLNVAYLGGSEASYVANSPAIPTLTITINRNGVAIASQTFSGSILGSDNNNGQRYWDVALPTINWAYSDATPGSGNVVYSFTITKTNFDTAPSGTITFTASQATSGSGSTTTAPHTHTAADVGAAALSGGSVFSGGGSFRAFSIRNTDANSWSWFAMGGTSDAGGGVWHIATNGTATDIGLGGALHIRGANGANSSMVINQDHSVRFRHLDIYAGATNSSNGWRLWHDGNAPVYAIRWPTLAEIGASASGHSHSAAEIGASPIGHTHTAAEIGASPIGHTHTAAEVGAVGTGGGSFNGVVTFNSEVHTNNMMTVAAPMISTDDHICSPISIRERGRVAGNQTENKYAPNLNFHWAGSISNSLWMDRAGTLYWGSYEADGTPTGNGSFNTSWISASTLSTVGKGGMIAYNGTAGMVLRTQDAGGGFARGIVAENAAGTRLGGAGFYGDSNGVYSFAVSLKENWWATPQFEVAPNSININSTYLTLTQGWDISWGGRWSSGFPTITGNSASIYMYPNGSSGGAYVLTSSKLEFPVSFDAYMAPAGAGFHGFLTSAGNAKPVAVGGLLVSSAYNEASSVPANGLLVRGSAVIGSHIDANAQEYVPSRSQLQIYSLNGSEARLAFHRGGYTVTTLAHDGDGLYLTNGTLRATGFKMNGRATTITTGAGNQDAISIQSPYGYIDIGSLNPTYAHITTDRPYFYMDKELSIQNGIDIYGTQWYFGRNSKSKIGSFQARHIDGLSPDGTLYDSLYLNYINNNDVVIGEGGGARLIAKSLINQVMARWTSSEDARSVGLRAPTSYQNVATYEFLDGATLAIGLNEYVGSLVFRPYGTGTDFSGGPVHKLHFAAGGRLFHQMGDGAGWASHREIPQYEPSGYLYARSWINLPSGTGIFFSDGVTHLRHLGNGQMALQGSAGTTFLRIDAAGSAQGFLYGEVGGNIGLLDNTGSWVLQCVAGSKMVYVKDFTVTSDSRLKDNQQLIKNALHKVRYILNGKTYIRNDSGRPSAGLIAQDVIHALPEAVTTEEKTGYYTVNYNGVIGLLVEAIKELADIVDGRGTTWQQ